MMDLLVGRWRRSLLRLSGLPGSGLGLAGLARSRARATSTDAQHILNLLGRVILGPAEHEALGDALATQLVDLTQK